MRCFFKPVAPNTITIDISGNLTHPLKNVQVHVKADYSYNGITFVKFPVDVWESVCAYHTGKFEPVVNTFYSNFMYYWNINHPCPYEGDITMYAEKYKVNSFLVEQILPSGRYRFYANLTEGRKREMVAAIRISISISDHRVHGFWFRFAMKTPHRQTQSSHIFLFKFKVLNVFVTRNCWAKVVIQFEGSWNKFDDILNSLVSAFFYSSV